MVVAAAGVGLVFSSFSTYDFVQHLDGQVHSVHCSFVPGLAAPDASGTSGCTATMMSRYSSVGRSFLWGGVPVSLAAMGVFAFLIFFAADVIWSRRERDVAATGLLAMATGVPAFASLVMGIIAAVELGTACKLCIGIYVASAAALAGGFGAWQANRRQRFELGDETAPERWRPQPATRGYLGLVVAAGLLFVAAPAIAYVSVAPEHREYLSRCGTLDVASDTYGVMIPVGERGDVPMVEVIDPLCPACRALDERIGHVDGAARLERRLLLFPLDNACNWTVDVAVHPGACTVSEAMLCARDEAPAVMAWAFANQEEIRAAAADDPRAARRMVVAAFPKLGGCVGTARARTRLNKSLRWAVRNRLPLLTPQLFMSGVRVCDADTDLGLDYALTALLEMHDAGELPKPKRLPRRDVWRQEPVEPRSGAAAAAPPWAGQSEDAAADRQAAVGPVAPADEGTEAGDEATGVSAADQSSPAVNEDGETPDRSTGSMAVGEQSEAATPDDNAPNGAKGGGDADEPGEAAASDGATPDEPVADPTEERL